MFLNIFILYYCFCRFVAMGDCDCFVEKEQLEKYLNLRQKFVRMKKCPSCKQKIYNLRRYHDIVSKTKQNILQASNKTLSQANTKSPDCKNIFETLKSNYCSIYIISYAYF